MKIGVLLFCPVLIAGCLHWNRDIEVHGVTFEKARVDKNGFVIGRVAQDTVVAGRPCRKGWLHLHPNGVPAGFAAATDIRLPRLTIPAGTWVFQDPDGIVTVCAFPGDTEVQGHVCRGGAGGAEGIQTAFYPDGALKQFFAPADLRIDGIPCAAGLFGPGIELYASGRLRSATLAADCELNGRAYRKGERIHLTPAGQLTM